MGNCLHRKETTSKKSSSSYMGFKVVSTKNDSKFSKIFFICKKRLSFNRENSNGWFSKGESPRMRTLFEYEDPISKNRIKFPLIFRYHWGFWSDEIPQDRKYRGHCIKTFYWLKWENMNTFLFLTYKKRVCLEGNFCWKARSLKKNMKINREEFISQF